MVLRIGNDAVVLLTTGISLEFIQREYLRQLLGFMVYASEIAHGGHAGHIETATDLLGGYLTFTKMGLLPQSKCARQFVMTHAL